MGGDVGVLMEVLSSEINTVAEGNDCSDEPHRKKGGAKRSGGSATTHTHACVVALSYNGWGIPACCNHGNQVRTNSTQLSFNHRHLDESK